MRIISVPVTATSKFKKTIESSWNALSLEISPKTNGLGVRGHERSKTAFLSETVFRWLRAEREAIERVYFYIPEKSQFERPAGRPWSRSLKLISLERDDQFTNGHQYDFTIQSIDRRTETV